MEYRDCVSGSQMQHHRRCKLGAWQCLAEHACVSKLSSSCFLWIECRAWVQRELEYTIISAVHVSIPIYDTYIIYMYEYTHNIYIYI